MTPVNGFEHERSIPYLLDQVHRRMRQDLPANVDASPFDDLRGSHFRLLSMIPKQGARPSNLAEVAGMTRPALGELVRHLEDHGYVTSERDDTDGRAYIVRHTARGRKAAAAAAKGIEALERAWAAEIGNEQFTAMRTALARLTVDRRAPQLRD